MGKEAEKIADKLLELVKAIEPDEEQTPEKRKKLVEAIDVTLNLAGIIVPVLVRLAVTEYEKIKSGKYAE